MLSFTLNTLLEKCNNKEARHAMHKAFSNTDEITMIDFDSFVDDMGYSVSDEAFHALNKVLTYMQDEENYAYAYELDRQAAAREYFGY